MPTDSSAASANSRHAHRPLRWIDAPIMDRGSSLAAQGREQDHVADAGAVGQQHHQAVDADAATARRGHAVFQRADEIGVVVDRKSTRLNSSHSQISYAVFCL